MQAIADLRGWSPFVALQIPYSLAERTVERELMPMAVEMGLGVVPWGTLGSGLLSGKYTRDDLKPVQASGIGAVNTRKDMGVITGRLNARVLDIADVVKQVAEELGRSPTQVALAWAMLNPAVASPIIGCRTSAQLEQNLGALDIVFSPEQVERLDAISRIDMGVPHNFIHADMTFQTFGAVKVEHRRR
jgi:aryl-alcohol dehydrogenase-like predicted oxidoreductase